MKHQYKVLIVDTEEETLCRLKGLLEQENYAVDTAQNAANALDKVKSDKYHIVLIETDLPEMDGIELLKAIKSYDALTQVIMVARHSTMEKVLSSLEFGANDYIPKPFENMEFVLQVIDYSVQKLERWREAIIRLVI